MSNASKLTPSSPKHGELSTSAATRRSGSASAPGRFLVGLAGLVLVGSGLWAMLSPGSFYSLVATYPPFNRHFVHDLGAFLLGLGASLVLALPVADALLVVLSANAVAGVAHFISHVVDRELGGLASDPVTIGLFALLLVGLTVWRARGVVEPVRG
ncbi:MAG: hypothetical protein ACR2IK_15165 [Chloroflexota bacterium]